MILLLLLFLFVLIRPKQYRFYCYYANCCNSYVRMTYVFVSNNIRVKKKNQLIQLINTVLNFFDC